MIDLGGLPLRAPRQRPFRNIVSLRESANLFDDLSDVPDDWGTAQVLEMDTKPWPYRSDAPIIDRPFEEAEFTSAVLYPFAPTHWAASRFSRGDFGVWYGNDALDTTIYETAHHWYQNLLADAGWEDRMGVTMERRVHQVTCRAHLIDLTGQVVTWPDLVANDYTFCQTLGQQVHDEGHPGLWTPSARCTGTNACLFSPQPLSAPSTVCYLTYILRPAGIEVYRDPGTKPTLVIKTREDAVDLVRHARNRGGLDDSQTQELANREVRDHRT